ncbi:unnamed protein product [Spirodela intermedia]|uniref:Uncharacterized protein n=1 Tax=Spirodela intermedia TaxID=51605 RepID=A0A7I8KQ03_SPIIN|nr:unnamed protein product [Spirodela intermedia]
MAACHHHTVPGVLTVSGAMQPHSYRHKMEKAELPSLPCMGKMGRDPFHHRPPRLDGNGSCYFQGTVAATSEAALAVVAMTETAFVLEILLGVDATDTGELWSRIPR